MSERVITGHRGYIGHHLMAMPHFAGFFCIDRKVGSNYQSWGGPGTPHDVELLVHLAASVSVMESFRDPVGYFQNNLIGLARFLKNNRVKKIVFASTGGALYGNAHGAKEEDARWDMCLSPYAQSKFLAEELIREMCEQYVILRLANVYGGDHGLRGEASMHGHFEQDDPILVYGGQQTRDFIHMDAVCSAIGKAMLLDASGTFNIGSGQETEVGAVAEEYAKKRGVRWQLHPARPGEVDYISLDITKAKGAGLL